MAVEAVAPAAPGLAAAVVDLQTPEGCALVGARWRYADARLAEVAFVEPGHPDDPLGPGLVPNRTLEVQPAAGAADFDDAGWRELAPEDTRARLGSGRVCFGWYRTTVTLPARLGDTDIAGTTVVFEVVVDDYAEVWVDGALPRALGDRGGPVVAGFNAPNRVVLTRDARPGDTFTIAVFAINGPISAGPPNYLWLRSATLDVHTPAPPPPAGEPERIATGFVFTEGPLWSRADGALLFSSPNTNEILRWSPAADVTVFRTKSGYAGVDVGRYAQPGANGLTFDAEGRLIACQHGRRRVIRVNPHGDETVLADRFQGRRLNSPNDVVCRPDGTVFFTDPPFGLPGVAGDPARELPFSGVFRVREGEPAALVTDGLDGPNGLAFAPGGDVLYVGNWPLEPGGRKLVMRYALDAAGDVVDEAVLADLTDAPGEEGIDGIKADTAGTLYVCGPGGIWVLSPAGDVQRLIELPEAPHNLAWGDADGRSLYVTAMTSVYRLRVDVPGLVP